MHRKRGHQKKFYCALFQPKTDLQKSLKKSNFGANLDLSLPKIGLVFIGLLQLAKNQEKIMSQLPFSAYFIFTCTEDLSVLNLQKKLSRDISKNCSSLVGCEVEAECATTHQIKLFLELSDIFVSVIFNSKKDGCI